LELRLDCRAPFSRNIVQQAFKGGDFICHLGQMILRVYVRVHSPVLDPGRLQTAINSTILRLMQTLKKTIIT
jgi:hypothetical protein